MRMKIFRSHDYRGGKSRIAELNLITPWGQLRLVLPKLGLSVWGRDYRQVARWNYPATG